MVITVTNADEDGTITLSSVQPKVGIPFMATLTDPDGVVVESVKWQWYSDKPDGTTEGTLDNDANGDAIAKAKSDTYTPKRADLDGNDDETADDPIFLYVWATYTDSTGSGKTATKAAANRVAVNQENQPP